VLEGCGPHRVAGTGSERAGSGGEEHVITSAARRKSRAVAWDGFSVLRPASAQRPQPAPARSHRRAAWCGAEGQGFRASERW
jgi:hypothetical protein